MLVTADLASPCKTILLDLAKKSRRDLLSPARHTCSTLLKHASCKDLQGHANSHHLMCLAKLFCKNGFLGRHTRFSSYHFLNLKNIQMFYATCCFWFSVIFGQLSSWSSFILFSLFNISFNSLSILVLIFTTFFSSDKTSKYIIWYLKNVTFKDFNL